MKHVRFQFQESQEIGQEIQGKSEKCSESQVQCQESQAIVMKARKCVWKAKESIKKGSESNILCTHYFLHFVLQKEDPKDKFEKNKRQTKGFK